MTKIVRRGCLKFPSPTNQPSDWLTNWLTNKPTNLPAYLSTYLLTYQPTNWSLDKPNNQPTNQPTYLPTYLPTKQPTNQRTDQLTAQPNNQPTMWLTDQPISQLTIQPAHQPSHWLTDWLTDHPNNTSLLNPPPFCPSLFRRFSHYCPRSSSSQSVELCSDNLLAKLAASWSKHSSWDFLFLYICDNPAWLLLPPSGQKISYFNVPSKLSEISILAAAFIVPQRASSCLPVL